MITQHEMSCIEDALLDLKKEEGIDVAFESGPMIEGLLIIVSKNDKKVKRKIPQFELITANSVVLHVVMNIGAALEQLDAIA